MPIYATPNLYPTPKICDSQGKPTLCGLLRKFSRSNNFVIFVKYKLITKFLSTKFFYPYGRVYWSSNESRKVLSVRSCAGRITEVLDLENLELYGTHPQAK